MEEEHSYVELVTSLGLGGRMRTLEKMVRDDQHSYASKTLFSFDCVCLPIIFQGNIMPGAGVLVPGARAYR